MAKPLGGKPIVVEVEGYEGEDTGINVSGSQDTGENGRPVLYCVGQVDDDGVLRFVDNGYRTITEAFVAWPDAKWYEARPPVANE